MPHTRQFAINCLVRALLLVLTVLGVFQPTIAQNLVTNAGFEQPSFSLNPNYRYLNGTNATFLTGWTFTYDGVQEPSYVYHFTRYPVFAGSHSVSLNDGDSCSTTFVTQAGQDYLLSVTLVGNDGGLVQFRAGDLDVSFNPGNGSTPPVPCASSTGTGIFFNASTEWRRVSLPFTARSSSTTLTIADAPQGLPFQGRLLDDISIIPFERCCPADINHDASVNVTDLLSVITNWGGCPSPCPPRCGSDIAPAIADCNVNVTDLLAVITAWGNCP